MRQKQVCNGLNGREPASLERARVHPGVVKGAVAAACGVALLITMAAGIGVWQTRSQGAAAPAARPAASFTSIRPATERVSYYLVGSQEQADAMQETWATSVYEAGVPDLASRHLVVIDSPEADQQFLQEVGAYDDPSATTRAYVVDLRARSAGSERPAPTPTPPVDGRARLQLLSYVVGSQDDAHRAQLALDTGPDGGDPVQPLNTASIVVVLASPADEAAFRAAIAGEQPAAAIVDLRR